MSSGAGRHKQEVGPADGANLDSGYAWLILALMFLLNSSISGASRVYGLVYAKQVAIGYYDRQAASWPIATASAVENLAGVLTPALAAHFSWRQLELLSTSLFVLANLAAYFSGSLALDILSLGLVQGLALSISTVLALAINNDYFERYRTTAYGIAMSGSTFGVLYLNPIVSRLLSAGDDFRLVYLALAGVFCLNMVLVLFIKPRSETLKSAQLVSHKEPAASLAGRKVSRCLESHFERKRSVAFISDECRSRRQSVWSQHSTASGRLSVRSASSGRHHCQSAASHLAAERAPAEPASPNPAKKISLVFSIQPRDLESSGPPADARDRAGSEPFGLESVLDLLKLPYLHCAWVMLAIYYLVSRVFIIILVDFADDHGLDEDEARNLLNFWSLGELLGRVLLGSFVDLHWLSVRSCIALTCSSLAALIALMVLVESYYVYAACATLVAALISLEYMLINVLMVEYLGKSRVTSCYSLAALISSLVLFGRPTMIGLFRDRLGSYDGLLLLLAGVSLAYGLLFGLLEPLLVRRWPKQPTG